jgi:hypothetical protein
MEELVVKMDRSIHAIVKLHFCTVKTVTRKIPASNMYVQKENILSVFWTIRKNLNVSLKILDSTT